MTWTPRPAISRTTPVRVAPVHALSVLCIAATLPLLSTLMVSQANQLFCTAFGLALLLLLRQYKKALGMAIYCGILWLGLFLFTENGVDAALLSFFMMLLMFAPCIMLAMAILSAYRSIDIMAALERLHLPKVFVIALSVTLRYIPTFWHEFGIIRDAMATRGVRPSARHPLRTLEYYVVPQLFRCLHLSLELTAAGLCRGIHAPGRRVRYFDRPLRLIDGAVLLIFYGGYISIWRWCR